MSSTSNDGCASHAIVCPEWLPQSDTLVVAHCWFAFLSLRLSGSKLNVLIICLGCPVQACPCPLPRFCPELSWALGCLRAPRVSTGSSVPRCARAVAPLSVFHPLLSGLIFRDSFICSRSHSYIGPQFALEVLPFIPAQLSLRQCQISCKDPGLFTCCYASFCAAQVSQSRNAIQWHRADYIEPEC